MSERARYWRRVVAEWKRSGLSQAAFCREHDIKPVTFGWWKRKLVGVAERKRLDRSHAKRASEMKNVLLKPVTATAGFVEVPLGQSRSTGHALVPPAGHGVAPPSGYEVVLPGGPTIRLPHNFDPDRVTRLVLALRSPC